jgi:hypothetical protein
MKKILKISSLFLFLCSARFITEAQSPPRLSISNDSPTSVQINWTNTIGTSYRVLFTPNLTNRLSVWPPLEDAFSADTNVSVSVSRIVTSNGFFSVEIPTNGISPAVQIFSPTNGQTVGGTIAIGVGAQIGNQLEGVNLYSDNALVGYVDSGGIEFDLDTTHFTNGLHTLYASAVDIGNNVTASTPISLDFENPVRWLDADSLFQSFVPIVVQSDIFPANWSVFVANTNGTIIRTFSGTTSDGNINTNWDGNDNNGVYAPDDAGYTVSVVVTSSGSPMMAPSSLPASSGLLLLSASPNAYGVMEYQVEVPTPDPAVTYSNLVKNFLLMPANERIIFPPFWSLPIEPSTPTIKTFSVYDMFILQHQISGTGTAQAIDVNADLSSGSGSTSYAIWREALWRSGETILSKVTISGIFNTTIQNYLVQLRTLIDTAAGSVSGDRGVFGPDAIYVLNTSGDFSALTNHLASTSPYDARAFYFYGHGNPDGNAIGTTSVGVRAKDLGTVLGNSYKPFRAGQTLSIITRKPFVFVFLDGCLTGIGSFPEAFGIPKISSDVSYNDFHKHKRAFMGWGGVLTFQFNNTYFNWTQSFWNSWLNDVFGYTRTVQQAVDDANAANPGVTNSVPMMIYGSHSLTWSN